MGLYCTCHDAFIVCDEVQISQAGICSCGDNDVESREYFVQVEGTTSTDIVSFSVGAHDSKDTMHLFGGLSPTFLG